MLTVEIKHELDDGLSSDSIEATGGLIGQQQGWCRDKSARQCDARGIEIDGTNVSAKEHPDSGLT